MDMSSDWVCVEIVGGGISSYLCFKIGLCDQSGGKYSLLSGSHTWHEGEGQHVSCVALRGDIISCKVCTSVSCVMNSSL